MKKQRKKILANKLVAEKRKKILANELVKKQGRNVEVKALPKLKNSDSPVERVSSGVPVFDSLVGGGFEKNSINLVVGIAGCGKTIFAAHFLAEGMKNGEKCLYVTFEERKEQFYHNMRGVGIDLGAYEKKGLLTFLEYNPLKVKSMLEEGGGAIESVILEKKITRIVIDSMTSVALLFEDEQSQREAFLSLFNMISGWESTALLTIEEDPLDKGKNSAKVLEFEADSMIMIYYVIDESERRRFLEVRKMRGCDHSRKIYEFTIGKKGIQVSKASMKKIPQEVL